MYKDIHLRIQNEKKNVRDYILPILQIEKKIVQQMFSEYDIHLAVLKGETREYLSTPISPEYCVRLFLSVHVYKNILRHSFTSYI
jgi:hypothetical protein